MGVPAFYRWLSEKYPKIVEDVLEERVHLASEGTGSIPLPFDATKPNPSGLECDNLYIDMNGIIHPCSHPENGVQPKTQEEMYDNVCRYTDRLFRAMRPRKLLFLAIDGVAPRAKMNQQRSRRFRSAQEARELKELEQHVRSELEESNGTRLPLSKKDPWDSNVITPGTPFMLGLSDYIRFYIRKRMSEDKAWRNLRVVFSDASVPGEGEHKIMDHVRRQRSQPGYNANTVHVLHGLDADLIMLALATHEAHFYVTREQVTFGRKSQETTEQRQMENGYTEAQRLFDEAAGPQAMQTLIWENGGKPLERISIPTLREYIAAEFATPCLDARVLPFPPSLERLIDDVVFLCFFVGNDFLPHLPSLDIRDGGLDFLINVYKRLLPSLGDYITKSGGNVNLQHVNAILAEVGAIEDYVFAMKHDNEKRQEQRRQQFRQRDNKKGAPPPPSPAAAVPPPIVDRKRMGRAAKILDQQAETAVALSRGHQAKEDERHAQKARHMMQSDNAKAAQALKESLLGKQQPAKDEAKKDAAAAAAADDDDDDYAKGGGEQEEDNTTTEPPPPDKNDEIAEQDADADVSMKDAEANAKRKRDGGNDNVDNVPDQQEPSETAIQDEVGIVGDAEEEFEDDAEDEDEDDIDADLPKVDDIVDVVEEEVDPQAAAAFKERVKTEQQKKLDDYAKNVQDNVRLHESGWKDRYYTDKCKADDVANHGGREHLFRSYVVGLCWVMKYYYDGCPSWKWYYPFHYAPFASDLQNIERFQKDCKSLELATPFNPVEQLMAVLPSDSAHAIPKASRWLMLDEESPIIDFYPKDVPVDPNGKAMPWLWVVLLPFIDEERLLAAMAPTMAKWAKEELLCNARGLDDGYLYIHRNHPLAKKLAMVLEEGKTAKAPKTRLTDAASYGCAGFSGSVRPPLSNEIYPINEDVVIPPLATAGRIDASSVYDSIFAESIDPNDAICVAFSEPPKLSHKSVLLPGAKLQRPKLTAEDKVIRRPRLNRGGGSIANMGMSSGQSYKSGYGSMNIGSYERQLAERTGRGNQLYQPGTRAWGAMEPTPKRVRQGPPPPPPQVQNPFMGQPRPGPPVQQQYGNQLQWQNGNQWSGQQTQSGPRMPPQPPQQYHQQQQQGQQYAYGQQGGQYQQALPQHHQQSPPQQYGGYQQQQQHQQWGVGGYQQQQQQQQPHNQGRNQPPNYGNRNQPPPYSQPPHRQQGHDFRSFVNQQQQQPSNYGTSDPRSQQGPQQSNNAGQQGGRGRGRASSDVMSNLKAQLASTLKQNRRQGP